MRISEEVRKAVLAFLVKCRKRAEMPSSCSEDRELDSLIDIFEKGTDPTLKVNN